MKRTICLLLALCCVLSLCACGSSSKTPFDGLEDSPEYDTVLKRYGNEPQIDNGKGLVYPYNWLGYDGELYIYIRNPGGVYRSEGGNWKTYPDDTSETASKIYNELNRQFGTGITNGDGIDWHDSKGNEYSLYSSGNVVMVYFTTA